MLKEMLDRNPLLKVLVPLLLGCIVIFVGVRLFNPQLSHREELRQLVLQQEEEMAKLQEMADSIAHIDEKELEDKLVSLKSDLGLGYYSPEIIHFLEDIANETGINITRYIIQDLGSEDGLHRYQLVVDFRGRYLAALEFQTKLEDFPAYSDADLILASAGEEHPGLVDGSASFVITTIPQEYEQIEESELPLRENPFL
ncbi:MAG: hypothetical protein WAP58_06095 [Peptococcia bacterium]